MKKLTIISGKGGTGKTSLVASFAFLARSRTVMVDGDVDAANLNLVTNPVLLESHEFIASSVAVINEEKCDQCNLCLELCRFNAISIDYRVDSISCEGCWFCHYSCPREAIEMKKKKSGKWYVSQTPYGKLVHAKLGIAEENSGRLVTTIRSRGEELAGLDDAEYLLIDGPPGIGCPVIASISGADQALIVTEPTVSGIHDLERAVSVCRHFQVPVMVCINRFDLGEEQTETIENYCRGEGISVAGKIPFDRRFVDAMVKRAPVVEFAGDKLRDQIENVWDNINI